MHSFCFFFNFQMAWNVKKKKVRLTKQSCDTDGNRGVETEELVRGEEAPRLTR